MNTKGYKKPKPGEFIMRAGWTMPTTPCKRGHLAPRTTNGSCAQCLRDYRKEKNHFSDKEKTKEWYAKNKKQLAANRIEYNKNNPEAVIVSSCRRVAKAKNVPFNLTIDDIFIPKVCPILGIELYASYGLRTDHSPSIDRIIPELGYTKGNIIVISMRANRIKNDATVDELCKIANFYKELIDHENRTKSKLPT